MFTGIVEGARPVVAREEVGQSLRLAVDLEDLAEGVRVGDSIAVAGCCLTVESLEGTTAGFHLMGETVGLTTFGSRNPGDRVNIERSLRIGDRLGGHFVYGHVDGVGHVSRLVPGDGETDVTVELPERLRDLAIPKGSIAIDGVSLTLTAIEGRHVSVALIPHTLEVTTLGGLRAGDRVHLEMDMIGKWVKSLLP